MISLGASSDAVTELAEVTEVVKAMVTELAKVEITELAEVSKRESSDFSQGPTIKVDDSFCIRHQADCLKAASTINW